MRHLIIILGLFVFTSCEKDPEIVNELEPSNLADYLSRIEEGKVSYRLWAHAGNHPSFERITDQKAVHIRMFLPNGYERVKLFISDSASYPDSLELFYSMDKELTEQSDNLFGLFALKETASRSRLAMVSVETPDSVYLSSPILLRVNNSATNTKNASDVWIETTAGGRAYINWNGAGIDEPWKNLVEIRDQTGEVFCAVETNNLSFLFHDLRNVSRDFTPALRDPRLIEGQHYSLTIYRNDNQGWMRNYRKVEFEADSTLIQQFE